MNSDHVREYVLRAIADDYEDFERIFGDVVGWGHEHGIVASRSATQRALETLVSEGYAKAYSLDPTRPAESVIYSATQLDRLWFYVTPNGKSLAAELSKNWS